MDAYRIVYSFHAFERMTERNISRKDISDALLLGEVIAHDPYISKSLILHWCSERPIHVIIITNDVDKTNRIVTAYQPSVH